MFCPLKGTGCSPPRCKSRQRAAVINDFPAPLLVPSTIKGANLLADFKAEANGA
jgi:hypothetical protein